MYVNWYDDYPVKNNIIDVGRVDTGTEPISLVQAKSHLRITHTSDDTELTSLITQCRRIIEEFCCVSIVTKTVTFIGSLYGGMELPYGPVIALVTVQTGSSEGSGVTVYTTLDSWGLEGEGFVTFNPPGGWGDPRINIRHGGYARYKIVYTAGYATVPEDLKLAILNEIYWRYEHKGNEVDSIGISEAARRIALPFKRMIWT